MNTKTKSLCRTKSQSLHLMSIYDNIFLRTAKKRGGSTYLVAQLTHCSPTDSVITLMMTSGLRIFRIIILNLLLIHTDVISIDGCQKVYMWLAVLGMISRKDQMQ